jgi:hypothetical protein
LIDLSFRSPIIFRFRKCAAAAEIVKILQQALADTERGLGSMELNASDDVLKKIASYTSGGSVPDSNQATPANPKSAYPNFRLVALTNNSGTWSATTWGGARPRRTWVEITAGAAPAAQLFQWTGSAEPVTGRRAPA